MESLHSRIPYAQWRLQILRQLFPPSGSSNSTFLSRRVHSCYNHGQTNPDTTTTRNDNKNNTHGNDNADSTTPPSQLLPQSPLITHPHPGRTVRHRKKYLPTSDDLSDLSKNPWAMALASPVRMCSITGARMPRALLSEWGMVEQPLSAIDSNPGPNLQPKAYPREDQNTKSKLWLLPVDLIKDDLVDSAQKSEGNVAFRPHLKFRMLDRIPILQTLTNSARRTHKSKHSPITPLLPFRWKTPFGPMTSADDSRLVWRLDMPDFVLRMKRRKALKQLKRVSNTLKQQGANKVWMTFDVQEPYSEEALLEGLMMEVQSRKEGLDRIERGVLFILGDGSGSDVGAGAVEAATISETVMLPGIGRKVPVFNLARLFSQAEIEEIRAHHPRFQKFAAFLKPSNKLTIETVLALWDLQGYVREP